MKRGQRASWILHSHHLQHFLSFVLNVAVCQKKETDYKLLFSDFPLSFDGEEDDPLTWRTRDFRRRKVFIQNNPLYTERCSKMNEKENLLQRHYYQETALIKPS
jgi:hypothetical protein